MYYLLLPFVTLPLKSTWPRLCYKPSDVKRFQRNQCYHFKLTSRGFVRNPRSVHFLEFCRGVWMPKMASSELGTIPRVSHWGSNRQRVKCSWELPLTDHSSTSPFRLSAASTLNFISQRTFAKVIKGTPLSNVT